MADGLFARLTTWARNSIPDRDALTRHRLLRPLAHKVLASEYWRFTRRSVPRGVTLGIIAGLVVIVPGLQIVGAVVLCVMMRGNIPAAALATFISNPITTPAIIYLFYLIGTSLIGVERQRTSAMGHGLMDMNVEQWTRWLLYEAGPPLLLGLFVVTVVFSVAGYLLSSWGWNLWVRRKRRRLLAGRRPNPVISERP